MSQNELTIAARLENIESLIKSQSTATKAVLSLDEVAEYTGLSKQYLYKLTSKNIIPFSRPNGKKIFFNKAEVDKWLLSNRQSTEEEIQSEAITKVTLNK